MKRLKHFALKAESLDGNTLKGAAAAYGNIDSYRECLFSGFFKSCLPDFRKSGFVSLSHRWSGLPIAMPTLAVERGRELYTEADFHSTQEAQDARTVCRERQEHDLLMGLSVGFGLDWESDMVRFDNSTKMLEYAKANGYDMSLFDEKGCNAHKKSCYGLLKGRVLWEYAITPMPANKEALVAEAKSMLGDREAFNDMTEREFEEFLRDAGCSRRFATAVTLHGFKAARGDDDEQAEDQRDADDPGDETTPVEAGPTAAPITLSVVNVADLRARALALELTFAGASL